MPFIFSPLLYACVSLSLKFVKNACVSFSPVSCMCNLFFSPLCMPVSPFFLCMPVSLFLSPLCMPVSLFLSPLCMPVSLFLSPLCMPVSLFLSPLCMPVSLFLSPLCMPVSLYILFYSIVHCVSLSLSLSLFATSYLLALKNLSNSNDSQDGVP
ncbi:unnamed protein product [Acanthosepion pharaonis]|uniref:Uncharacterized protein n=1 Tax=Acanthosepion pharaonis TaxID=158019 RepID=A0A812C8K2_ACAPH|nr:unnamed protein product [Sepia pharaonis]